MEGFAFGSASGRRGASEPSSSSNWDSSATASAAAAAAAAAAASRFLRPSTNARSSGLRKTSSLGGRQRQPSCCSWITRSASSTRLTLAATSSSCIAHTSSNFFVSARTNLLCFIWSSLNVSAARLCSSASLTFSAANFFSASACFCFSTISFSRANAIFLRCCEDVLWFSASRSTNTR